MFSRDFWTVRLKCQRNHLWCKRRRYRNMHRHQLWNWPTKVVRNFGAIFEFSWEIAILGENFEGENKLDPYLSGHLFNCEDLFSSSPLHCSRQEMRIRSLFTSGISLSARLSHSWEYLRKGHRGPGRLARVSKYVLINFRIFSELDDGITPTIIRTR